VSRVWGRTTNELGVKTWVEVTTDASGFNDAVNLTWLAQVIQLNLGESPFYGNWGIPQYQTIMTQILPTYYVMRIQGQFSPLFASLRIVQLPGYAQPTYRVSPVTQFGAILPPFDVAIPI
jgi:hypothetical protein